MTDIFDQLFAFGRRSPFVEGTPLVPQEAMPSPGQIAPTGFIEDSSVDEDQLATEAVSFTKFASGIVPPRVVAVLPTLPDSSYPIGSTVFLTTDGKLYKTETGLVGSWETVVNTTDLTGTIAFSQFASGIVPPRVVTSLPTLPDSNYPIGSIVYLTTDGHLYKTKTGLIGSWVAAVDSGDILADSITAGQIAAGAIGADELAANSVVAGKIAALTVTAAEIAANTITASQIAADTITAGQIAAAAIGVSELAAAAVTADKIAVGTRSTGNRVANPSFEELDGSSFPTTWYPAYRTTGSPGVWVSDDTAPQDGTLAVKAGVTSTAGTSLASRSFPVTPGEVFYVSAWLKGDVSTNYGAYIYVFYGTADGFTGFPAGFSSIASNVALTTSYVQHQGYATVPGGATWARVAVEIWTPDVTAVMFADNVVCERSAGGVKNSTGYTTIDSSGVTVTNGAITVTNAGSVVIIDGTSNMFKIVATGTASCAWPAAAPNTASTEVNVTVASTSVPYQILVLTCEASNFVYPRSFFELSTSTTGHINYHGEVYTYMSAVPSTTQVISLGLEACLSTPGAGVTAWCRYYVLKEAAI